ncbi:MAG: hypothetical protein GW839_14320 [Flavobacteriales bacterium]|nr:hypothetical protein [Flavobacteriales bacterium]NCP61458.1 hypothetical protein [Flavobacteriales bacterium]NCQ13201.1 hypothetical protein [Flavobacteriales bacterium]NCQ58834.1 hypothetical protein [Flavobacteriales bacterium]
MKKYKVLRITSLLISLLLLSCNKETCCDTPIENNPFVAPTAQEFSTIQDAALSNLIERVNFIADEGITFISENGAQLQIFPGCLTTTDGQLILDEVTLEFIEIYDKSNMLAPNKPTMGRMPTNDKALLITGGAFYINITHNGEDVVPVCGFQMLVPAALTGGADPNMTLWSGVIDDSGNLTWEPNPNGEVFVQNNVYSAFFQNLGWTNIDRFYDDPRPKTTIQVLVSEGYTAENSAVYMAFVGEDNGLANLDTFNHNTNMFSEHYGQLPIGLEVHLIFVTADTDSWRYAIQSITVNENQIYTIAHSETQTATLAEIQALIAALP